VLDPLLAVTEYVRLAAAEEVATQVLAELVQPTHV